MTQLSDVQEMIETGRIRTVSVFRSTVRGERVCVCLNNREVAAGTDLEEAFRIALARVERGAPPPTAEKPKRSLAGLLG